MSRSLSGHETLTGARGGVHHPVTLSKRGNLLDCHVLQRHSMQGGKNFLSYLAWTPKADTRSE